MLNFPLFRQLVEDLGASPEKKDTLAGTSILFESLKTHHWLRPSAELNLDRKTIFTTPNFSTVEFLLSLPGVNASGVTPGTRQTALHRLVLSTVQPRPDLIKLLVAKGADPKAKDSRGFMALDYANRIRELYYEHCKMRSAGFYYYPQVPSEYFNEACWKLYDKQVITLKELAPQTVKNTTAPLNANDIPNKDIPYAAITDGVISSIEDDYKPENAAKRGQNIAWCQSVAKWCR